MLIQGTYAASGGECTQRDSKTDTSIDLERTIREGQGATVEQTERRLPLGTILKACPDIALYDRNGIRSWRNLIATAGMVRGMLGISPSAWDGAREALGDIDAAVTVAAILQRAEERLWCAIRVVGAERSLDALSGDAL